jgi:hypothetical protein
MDSTRPESSWHRQIVIAEGHTFGTRGAHLKRRVAVTRDWAKGRSNKKTCQVQFSCEVQKWVTISPPVSNGE